MCDTCDTTIFNTHWTCEQCGFTVCSNCYFQCLSGSSNQGEHLLEFKRKHHHGKHFMQLVDDVTCFTVFKMASLTRLCILLHYTRGEVECWNVI